MNPLAVLVFTTVSFFASFALSQILEPGLWKSHASVKIGGLPLPATDATECISSEATTDVRSTIAKELKKQGCELKTWVVTGQKLEATLKCSRAPLRAEGKLAGVVKTKSYDLTGSANGTFHSIPAAATFRLTGQWASKCNP